jgi:hypothetical protein
MMGKAAAMTTPAAAQEPLAEQRQAGAAAPVAVRTGQPGLVGLVGRGDGGACGRHRGRRHQIIAGRCG